MARYFSCEREAAFVTFGGDAPDLVTTGVSLMSKCQQFVTRGRSHTKTQGRYALAHGTRDLALNSAGKGKIRTILNAARGADRAERASRGRPSCYRSFNIPAVANVRALSVGAPFSRIAVRYLSTGWAMIAADAEKK
jgi:hypothetical protein